MVREKLVSIQGLADGSEIPEFVIPTPVPHAIISGGFPLFLGPPLPQHELDLGDTWGTNEDGLVGQHRLVEQIQLGGNDVVTIESTYSFTQPEIGEEITATTTVWFDPVDGIVVQAQIIPKPDVARQEVEMEFQLIG